MAALRPLQPVLGGAPNLPPSKFGEQNCRRRDDQWQEVMLTAGKAISVNPAGDDSRPRCNQSDDPEDSDRHGCGAGRRKVEA
jgi:hypothetical protein